MELKTRRGLEGRDIPGKVGENAVKSTCVLTFMTI